MVQGSELTADAATGALQLTIDNPVDFDEDGGTVDLNDVQIDYTTVDMDTGIVTLATATTAAAETGDKLKIVGGGAPMIDYIAFVSLGDGDEIEVAIPYAQRDMWPEGEYDSPIAVDLSDDLEEIVNVPGRTPVRDGTFIDPDTLPAPVVPPSDGAAPSAAPTNVTVIGGIGALFIRWTPISNRDAVTYDVHVSPTAGFTPDASTLAVSTAASSHTLRELPTAIGTPPNQALSYDATYYFRVIPRDLDGVGPTSSEASGQMVQVTGPDVAAESITGDRIQGGTITGDLLSTTVVMGSTISTGGLDDNGNLVGARVDLGPDGMTTYAPDGVTPIVNFPLDPADDAFIHNAHLSMLSADVKDNLTVYGTNNELAASATLQLGSGINAPSTPPTMATTWDTVQLDTTTAVSGALGTFPLDPSQITSMCWDPPYSVWQIFQQRSTGFRQWHFNLDGSLRYAGSTPWIADITPAAQGSGCRNGWIFKFNTGVWYAWETVTGGGRYGIIPSSWIIAGQSPHMDFDEDAQISMLCQEDNASDVIRVRRFHTVPSVGGIMQNCVSDGVVTSALTAGTAGNLAACLYGSFDLGFNRYVSAVDVYTRAAVWNASTRYNGATNFQEWDCNGIPLGMGWDGVNFWSVNASGKLTKYTGWTWPTEPSTTWVGMSAYDSDVTGGTHETPVGTLANRNAVRRSKLTITVPATQDSGGSNDPDRWRTYFARTAGVTVPTALDMSLVASLGSPSLPQSVTIQADPTGISPPGGIYGQPGAANTFPAGSPAQILDGAGNVMLDGNGHGLVGIVGEVRMWAAAAPPPGWLICDGSAVSRSLNPALFATIGTVFGVGNGTTTFNLPDLRTRFPVGVGAWRALGVNEGNADGADRINRMNHTHSHSVGASATHTHDYSNATIAATTTGGGSLNRMTGGGSTGSAGAHDHGGSTGTTGLTDNTALHSHLALNFIIRT